MKTKKDIEKEISELTEEVDILKKQPYSKSRYSKIKRISNKVSILYGYLRYLKTNPSEEFIRSEIKRIQNSLEIIESRYAGWLGEREDIKELESEYNKLMEVPKFKKQLKTLKYFI